jgi:hypothetical protein
MLNDEQLQMLAQIDPLNLSTEQQCAYVLKCLEAEIPPEQICECRFCGDSFTFNLIMALLAKNGWAKKKASGKWIVKR